MTRTRSLATSFVLALALPASTDAASLRFFGHGGSPGDDFVFPDRVKILVEPPSSANVGAADFTIEFFLRSPSDENTNPGLACGFGIDWVNGNILIDRDRFNQGRKFGIALLGGRVAFGASDASVDYTLCGQTDLRDDAWHHVAVEKRASDGRLRLWVDGALDAEGPVAGGPGGDMSYPASAAPGSFCSPDGGSGSSSCENSDPYLVFGAEKHGFSGINYSGWLDEVRLSSGLRYTAPFTAPSAAFTPDATTLALYHFDEATGTSLGDASIGGAHGTIFVGGSAPAGPVWSSNSPFPPAIPGLGAPALVAVAAAFAVAGGWALRRTAARRAAMHRIEPHA
jgi:hypothetical protein